MIDEPHIPFEMDVLYEDERIIVVDKPHNWYLQTAVNTGVISMLMLLWLLAFLAERIAWWWRHDYCACGVMGVKNAGHG